MADPINIRAIIHPFFLGQRVYDNDKYYRSVIEEIDHEPNAMVFYTATVPGLSDKKDDELEGSPFFGRLEEKGLQTIMRARKEKGDRVYLLADEDNVRGQGWETNIYRPQGMRDLARQARRGEDAPLKFFLNEGVKTYYSEDMSEMYIDISEMSPEASIKLWKYEKHRDGDREYLIEKIHPQIAEMINQLGKEISRVTVDGKQTWKIPDEVRKRIQITGYGEYLEACVFAETVGLALALGAPLEGISLSKEQPYLDKEGREGGIQIEIYDHPVEWIYGYKNRGVESISEIGRLS